MIPSSRLWIPDVVIRNSEQQFLSRTNNGDDVELTSSGISARSISGTITFPCNLNMARFPFDVQTCSLSFDSWSLDTSKQIFKAFGAGTRLSNGYENEEWDVTDLKLAIKHTSYERLNYTRANPFLSIILPNFFKGRIQI